MWFGTENGLYSYDGINLHYFGHKSDDSTSLPNNHVLGISESKQGKLWVAMLSGIAEIDLATFQCKTYGGADKRFDLKNYTNRLCIDDIGNIWVGNSLGIFLFDKKNQVFTQVWGNKVAGLSLIHISEPTRPY